MKRLDLKGSAAPNTAIEWPDNSTPARQLLSARKPLRHLVVMIDAELIVDPDYPWTNANFTELKLLTDLLEYPLIRSFRYAGDGPPPGTPSESHQMGEVYPGWVVVGDIHPLGDSATASARFSPKPGCMTRAGISLSSSTIAEKDSSTDAYLDLLPATAAAKRHADALAAAVASDGVHADLFITERDFLHKRGGYAVRGVTVCTVSEALAWIGLYLRCQDEYCVNSAWKFNRGLYYWVGTRELLSSSWRWFGACVQHSQSTGDRSLTILAGSLLQRFDRALEARDKVHVALNQPQNNDLREDAISALDTILISFMAAFDVAARVAHRVLGLTSQEYLAGWQSQGRAGWWRQLNAIEPSLADVVANGTTGQHVLTILRLLRNSVHGAALQGVAYIQGRTQRGTLVGLPPQDEGTLLASMDALGGRNSWGVGATTQYGTLVDPGIVVEQLFKFVPSVLNELMDKTPVERLAGVQLGPADLVPSIDNYGNPFEGWKRRSIRLQLGL